MSAFSAAIVPNAAELGYRLEQELREQLCFERFNLGILDLERYEFIDAYVSGQNVPGRATGHRRTLVGTVVEAGIAAGDGVFVGPEGEQQLLARFPGFGPVLASGIRAMMAAPVYHRSDPIAALVVASTRSEAFDERCLGLLRQAAASSRPSILRFRSDFLS